MKNGLLPASEAARTQLNYELVIASSNLVPAWFLARGAECARAVAKVEARGVAHNGVRGTWNGTGFLVSPSILLTNWHVLNSSEVARQARARFRYEHLSTGLLDEGVAFDFNPARLWVSNRELDFTFVWVDGEPGLEFGSICLARNAFAVVAGECVNIVQHPNGRPKELTVQDNQVQSVDAVTLLYSTDTEPGSSGSCVFNNRWLPVALHHASQVDDAGKVANAGIRLPAIAAHLERLLTDADPVSAAPARTLLELFTGIDEVMGFFGALGRATDVDREAALQGVSQSYGGAAYDVDVGIWQLELPGAGPEIGRVAEALVRMNLDVWAFFDVSVESLERLVNHLSQQYAVALKWALAEPPGAPDRRVCAAVIWNERTVTVRTRRWPDCVESWFKGGALAAAGGPAPALFEVCAGNRGAALSPFEFFLVPLNQPLGDATSASAPRGASVLTAAIYALTRESGNARDWLIGGAVDVQRSFDDLRALTPAGLTASAGATPSGAGLVHLRGSCSSVDGLYMPAGSTWLEPRGAALGIASQPLPSLISELSSHPLVASRLSLADAEVARASAVDADRGQLDHVLTELYNLSRTIPGGP